MKPSSSTQRRASTTAPLDVVRRDHARAEHAVGRDVAEVLHPVVVRAGDGGGVRGLEAVGADLLDAVEPEHEQAARRVQHGQVEAFGVHRRRPATAASQPAASDAAYTLSCSSRQPVLRPSTCMAGARCPCAASRGSSPGRACRAGSPTSPGARRARTRGRCSAPRGPAAPSRAGRCRRSRGREGSSRQPNPCRSSARHGVRCAGRAPAAGPTSGGTRCRSASSGWATSVATWRPTSSPTVTTSSCTTSTRARAESIDGARAVASVARRRRGDAR